MKSLHRFELNAQTIILVGELLKEHLEVRRDCEIKARQLDSKLLSEADHQERAQLAVVKDRTQGAASALGAVIYSLYEGMGDDIKTLLSGAE